ncbi:hypothetical protein U1Q18_035266 [Sarracenia purpurea var. burkii]
MGFVGFLKLALKCFDLARPLFALGCPLYGSIRAIESNSYSDMRNLVAYWIVFSLISLFELAFVKLIDWLPFWPYMKLMAICWLVLPHFNGASQIYDCLIRPWLYVNLQNVIKQLIKPKENLSLNGENFLAVAEWYVKENGSEALEKLLDRKSKHTNPNIDVEEVEEVKAVTNTREKEPATAIQSQFKEPKVAKEDTEAVEQREVDTTAAIKRSKLEETNCAKENAKSRELKEKNPTLVTEWDKFVESILAQTKKKTVAAGEIKEKTVPPPNHAQPEKTSVAAGEIKDKNIPKPNHAQPQKKSVAAGEINEDTVAARGEENKVTKETNPSQKVQKEWTCAVCQVTTTSENNLNSHLRGKKHKAKCEELRSSKQAAKNKGSSSSSTANDQKPTNSVSGDRSNQPKAKKQEENVQVNGTTAQFKQKDKQKNTGSGMNQPKFWCYACNVKCPSEIHLASHVKGKKHLAQIQQFFG